VKSLSGKWYKFRTPVSLELELNLVSLLQSSLDPLSVISDAVSEILDLSPVVVDAEFTGDQILNVFNLAFPKVNPEESSQKLEEVQINLEKEGGSLIDSLSKMLTFLTFYGRFQPSEILRLPRATVEEILRETTGLLEADKKFQFELSVVHALGMIFGEGKSSGSSSSSFNKDTVDLSNIGEEDLGKIPPDMRSFIKVVK